MTSVGDFVYFALIHDWLGQRIIRFGADVMGRAMGWVGAMAMILVTLWILVQGYRLITGQSREPLTAMVPNMTRIAVITSVASTMALGSIQLQELFTSGLARGINELVSGSAESPVHAIDKNLAYTQLAMAAIDAVHVPAEDVATADAKARAIVIAMLGTAGPAMAAGAMLLLYQIAMALLIGFGPLFILCLAFGRTKELFHRWLMLGLGTLFSMAVLNFMISLVLELTLRVAGALWGTHVVSGITGANVEGFTSQAMQQGGVGLLMTVLIVSTPPMAAAFFRGVLGQFMSFSAFGTAGREIGATGHNYQDSPSTAYGSQAFTKNGNPSDVDVARGSIYHVPWGHAFKVRDGHLAADKIAVRASHSHLDPTDDSVRASSRPLQNAHRVSSMFLEPEVVRGGINSEGLTYHEWSSGVYSTQVRLSTLDGYSLEPIGPSRHEGIPEVQYSIGISGTVFIPITPVGVPAVGIGGGASIGVSTDGTLLGTSFFGQVQANGMVGVGAYAGIGIAPGVSHSETSPAKGWTSSTSGYFEVGAGLGLSGGMAGSADDSARISGGAVGLPLRVIPGVGYGAAAGVGATTSTMYVSQSFGEMLENLQSQPATEQEKP